MNTHSQPASYNSASCKRFGYTCECSQEKGKNVCPKHKYICFVLLRGLYFQLLPDKINDLCLLKSKLAIKLAYKNKQFILFYKENITASE